MKKKIVYLATPYTHNNPEIKEKRFQIVNEVAGYLINKGEIVFSPISQNHPIAKCCNLPGDCEYWLEFDKTFLEICCKLYVLTIEGWEESKGVQAEIKIAEENGIEIEYINYEEIINA
jgi:hypothetical protein